jgi:hypothetical protein
VAKIALKIVFKLKRVSHKLAVCTAFIRTYDSQTRIRPAHVWQSPSSSAFGGVKKENKKNRQSREAFPEEVDHMKVADLFESGRGSGARSPCAPPPPVPALHQSLYNDAPLCQAYNLHLRPQGHPKPSRPRFDSRREQSPQTVTSKVRFPPGTVTPNRHVQG